MKQTQEVSQTVDFDLYYEDMEKKVKKTAKKAVIVAKKSQKKTETGLRAKVVAKKAAIKLGFKNAVDKVKSQSKKPKKPTKKEREAKKVQQKNGILGIGLLLVIVSIAYTTSVTLILVDSRASLVALLPQVAFAFITLFKAFSKIYK